MSNKASDHLFELIKSLNKSEKRYFKIFSSRHTIGEENGYIRLFDFIDRMDDYNESLIFGHFHGQAFLNKFSITKGRLYSNILKSLDTFHSASSADAQIFRAIHSAEILYNKGLYKQCERTLNSAEKQARKYESFNLLLEIKEKQKRLLENDLYAEVKPSQIEKIAKEDREILTEIERYSELWKLKSLLFQEINRKGKIRDKKLLDKLSALAKQTSEFNIKSASTKVKYLYHHIHSAYYFSISDLAASFQHLKQNVELLEKDMILLKEQPNIYFSLLTNLIYVATKLKEYSVAEKYLKVLKKLPENSSSGSIDLDIKYFSSSTSLELSLFIEKGEFDKAIAMIPLIEEGYRLYEGRLNSIRKAYIDFKVGVVYLSVGKYTEALKWMNYILNETKIDQKQDIFCFAQLLNLILHVELKNSRFLPYAINSTRRYLKSRNRIYKFEELFLKLISQLSKADNIFDFEDKLIPVEKELKKLKEDKEERIVFDYFDFHAWVKSKIQRRAFQEVKKEQLIEEMA